MPNTPSTIPPESEQRAISTSHQHKSDPPQTKYEFLSYEEILNILNQQSNQ